MEIILNKTERIGIEKIVREEIERTAKEKRKIKYEKSKIGNGRAKI